MNPWHLRKGLRAIIILIIKTHPAAFRVLLGEYVPPSAEEICTMLGAFQNHADLDIRIDSCGNALPEAIRIIETDERFNSFIDAAGGWPHINKIVREWARHYVATWNLVIDHAVWVAYSASRINEAQMLQLEHKHKITRSTIRRRLEEFPASLANAIVLRPASKENCDLAKLSVNT